MSETEEMLLREAQELARSRGGALTDALLLLVLKELRQVRGELERARPPAPARGVRPFNREREADPDNARVDGAQVVQVAPGHAVAYSGSRDYADAVERVRRAQEAEASPMVGTTAGERCARCDGVGHHVSDCPYDGM